MKDTIPLGSGNSRFLKSVENFKALYPTYDAMVAALVAGTLPVDFNGVNPDGVSQIGTALNKLNLLKDATAEMYGLDSLAVPDDVFAELGKYKLHWWKKYLAPVTGYREKLVSRNSTSKPMLLTGPTDTFIYSKSISINQETGAVSLADPQTFSANGSCSSWYGDEIQGGEGLNEMSYDAEKVAKRVAALAPCYIKTQYDSTIIFYLPEGATSGSNKSTIIVDEYEDEDEDDEYGTYVYYGVNILLASSIQKVSSEIYVTEAGESFYICSTDRNAYPDSGEVDGYTYTYLGVPFDNAVFSPKIATGSYVGTGSYNDGSPNSLTFDFEPSLVFIYPKAGRGSSDEGVMLFRGMLAFDGFAQGIRPSSVSYYGVISNITWDAATVIWYASSAAKQQNISGKTYLYWAIG